ncbi:MAG TPA: TetR/AcrR family transcriptional regulator [Solirubrobacteraceae bacterium]|nr:TetR/AcrR family transcriptional regulator [Solirubrobacteraceae bacterium]
MARSEILAAAEELLRERAFRDLSVEDVMAVTSMSRSSFYVYFRDRHDLLLHLVQQIGDEIFALADRWYHGGGDPRAELREGLDGVAVAYARHGRVLRAISDAAVVDPQVETVYRSLIERFVVASEVRLAQEPVAGGVGVEQRQQIALSLVLMTERYLNHSFGDSVPLVTPALAAEALLVIWQRTLYG